QRAGCVPAGAAVAAGRAQGEQGGGAQAGADRVQPDALRRSVRQGGRAGVCRTGARTPGEAVGAAGPGAGIRVEEGGGVAAGGAGAAGTGLAGASAASWCRPPCAWEESAASEQKPSNAAPRSPCAPRGAGQHTNNYL